jgi:hypothetical protein
LRVFAAGRQSYRSGPQQVGTGFRGVDSQQGRTTVQTFGHGFLGRILGQLWVSVSVSLAAKCITAVTFELPEADNKSLLVGFPKLGFSLAGCQNSGCAHVFCDCCSLLFLLLFT